MTAQTIDLELRHYMINLGVIGLQWSMCGSCLNALCNMESGLYLNTLTILMPYIGHSREFGV